MTMSMIALDLGSSSIKGAVIEPEAMRITHIHRVPFPNALPNLPPLLSEVDPAEILSAVQSLISTLLPHAAGCRGIVVCGQMGGLILANERGEPLSNYISWKDKRAIGNHPSREGSHFDVMVQRLGPAECRRFGNEVRPGLPLSYLFCLTQEKYEVPPGAIACALSDFVVANLCGTAPGAEPTNAVGALNLETGDWHHQAFAHLGLDDIRWPRLCDLREQVGCLDVGSRSVPIYAPVGDHQCALAGAFIDFEELSVNISTGSQVSLLASNFVSGDYQTRPYFDGPFLNTITHIPAGRSLNTLVDLLTELSRAQGIAPPDPWPLIADAVANVEDTELKVNLAFFPSPVGDRGGITNIREGNLTVGNLFYAAYRNLAESCHTCALRLSPEQAWQRVVFSGGLTEKNDLLRMMILEKLPYPYRLSSSEETLTGLLALSLVICGMAPTVTAATGILKRRAGEIVNACER